MVRRNQLLPVISVAAAAAHGSASRTASLRGGMTWEAQQIVLHLTLCHHLGHKQEDSLASPCWGFFGPSLVVLVYLKSIVHLIFRFDYFQCCQEDLGFLQVLFFFSPLINRAELHGSCSKPRVKTRFS